MPNTSTYYVVAPIDGLHLDFDYRMYSAEVYGCPPNYAPNPKGCPEFRQPYEYLGNFSFNQYKQLIEEYKIDNETLHNLERNCSPQLRCGIANGGVWVNREQPW